MTEKELLYVEDMISHQMYFIQHLTDSVELLENRDFVKQIEKLIKKNKDIYTKFYNVLSGGK